MNMNLAHNILNLLIVIFGSMAGFDFTAFFSVAVAGQITAGLAALKLVMNALRDGLDGMTKPQPPVER